MKTKHDLANQLQLLDAYNTLNQTEKTVHLIQQLVNSFREEQQLLKLNCPMLIQYYIDTVLEERLFQWSFEIELLTSAIDHFDHILTSWISSCVTDFLKRVTNKAIITLSLFEYHDKIECYITLSGAIENINHVMMQATVTNHEMIEYYYELDLKSIEN
ncbi:Spo0B domain-containing protein [Macrococcoides caseolyticum]|uniref:Spo0B domain-containing protein n=1 Tax=Macrococcoides caseolyticum TaxID=69966 RepID=UPI001F40BC45|nr:Spo0B domain-containing protein [Macrococcus caseolyticus]MCE4956218.1 Spo0B domain-containing protein [Macrococcus caseolyticus]